MPETAKTEMAKRLAQLVKKVQADEFTATFEHLLKAVGLEGFVKEHRFHPERKFRFDFARLDKQVAVELHGGIWIRGRHLRGAGFEADCEKLNEAVRLGWRVLYFTPGMLKRDPWGSMALLKEVLEAQR